MMIEIKKIETPKKKVEKEEGKLKTTASDLGTASTNVATVLVDYGPLPRSSYAATQLKTANRILTKMVNQKQGT